MLKNKVVLLLFCGFLCRFALGDVEICENYLARSKASHTKIKESAAWPVDFNKIARLKPSDRSRALSRALRVRFSKAGSRRGSEKAYFAFFSQLRENGLTNSDILSLLKQVVDYPSFSLPTETVADLQLSSEEVWATFEYVQYMQTAKNLYRVGLFQHLMTVQKTAMMSKIVAKAGWSIFREALQYIDNGFEEEKKIFESVFSKSKFNFSRETLFDLKNYLESPRFNEDERYALLKILVDQKREPIINFIMINFNEFDLRPEMRRDLAIEIVSRANLNQVLNMLSVCKFVPEPVIFQSFDRLMKANANLTAYRTLFEAGSKMFSTKQLKTAFLANISKVLEAELFSGSTLASYGLDPSELWALMVRVAQKQEAQIVKIVKTSTLFEKYPGLPERLIMAVRPRTQLKSMEDGNDVAATDLKARLLDYAVSHPDAISATEAKLPWDRVQKVETGIKIIQLLLSHFKSENDATTDSLQIISQALFGQIDPSFVDQAAKMSSDKLGTLYELVLDLHSRLNGLPVFEAPTRIEPVLWKKQNLGVTLELLTGIRDWMMFTQNTSLAIALKAATASGDTIITDSNTNEVVQFFREAVVQNIKSMFAKDHPKFVFEDLIQLRELWGDLEPIFTLLSRYSGEQKWRSEIKILSRIFETTIYSQFQRYKYFGFEGDQKDLASAKSQLASLPNEEAVALWMANYNRAEVVSDANKLTQSQQDRAATARSIIETNILTHFNPKKSTKDERLQQAAVQKIMTDEFVRLESLVDELRYDEQLALNSVRADIIHANVLSNLIFEISETQDFVRLLKVSKFILGNGRSFKINLQQREDLQALVDVFDETQQGPKVQIIITTTFDDPKTLLMVGDLVKTSSCQNYRTGGYAQTLPSYVIDANIKGIASFSLDMQNFESLNDFEAVRNELKQHRMSSTKYDGNKRRFSFTLSNGTEVFSRPLSYAYLRQIVRLGSVQSSEGAIPALFLERPYQQTHARTEIMKAQVADIFADLAKRLNAKTTGKIQIVKSRNPQGGYSDAGGGVKQTDYELQK